MQNCRKTSHQARGGGRTRGDLLKGGRQVGALDGREEEVERGGDEQRQAPDSDNNERHEVRGQEHVEQDRQACKLRGAGRFLHGVLGVGRGKAHEKAWHWRSTTLGTMAHQAFTTQASV